MPAVYDRIVLGLGGMGSAALCQLAGRKQRVLGLEQFHPSHALGSSHGGSRIIRQAYFEDPSYVPLLLRAYELWDDLAQATQREFFVQTGGLMAGRPDCDVVAGSTRSALEHGLAHELLDPDQIRRRFPALRPRHDEIALFEAKAGLLFPEECISAHLQKAVATGAEARFGVKVTGWRITPEGLVVVQTDSGEVAAEGLVITAGAWLGQIAPDLGLPLQVERNVMHWFEPKANAEHFGPDQLPIYIVERPECTPFYGFPNIGGGGIKIGLHHSKNVTTIASLDRAVANPEVAEMREILAGWMPDGAGRSIRSAVCMYTNTPDENFVIGQHPLHPQVVLAGGFSGHGFKFCSVVGEVLADLALTGTSRHEIDLFRPDRFAVT